ncbi:MAG TPA: hypothetical protein VIY27_00300 [Myxococcota bacterium]
MEATSDPQSRAARRRLAFKLFKYGVFAILLINLCFYLVEDVRACLYLDSGATFGDYLQTAAATIDYVAWIVLIILFEMETSAHAKGAFRGIRKWAIAGMTAACYLVLVYATYGYTVGLADTYRFEPIDSATVCDLAQGTFAYVNSAGRPVELNLENCGDFANERVYRSAADRLIATHENLVAIQKLGWVNVANAAAWLLVVLIFQVEITLNQLDKLTRFWLLFCSATKAVLYLVLFADAIYWTFYSAFIDSWDAWIWLIAFLLIDLNLLGLEDLPPAPAIAPTA